MGSSQSSAHRRSSLRIEKRLIFHCGAASFKWLYCLHVRFQKYFNCLFAINSERREKVLTSFLLALSELRGVSKLTFPLNDKVAVDLTATLALAHSPIVCTLVCFCLSQHTLPKQTRPVVWKLIYDSSEGKLLMRTHCCLPRISCNSARTLQPRNTNCIETENYNDKFLLFLWCIFI